MVRFDTISFEVPPQIVDGVQPHHLITTTRLDGSTGVEDCFKQIKPDILPIGFSSIKYRQGGNWQITMSAKTLLDDYLEGVNLNTFEQSLCKLQPVFGVSMYDLWEANPKVLRCDTTNNISLSDLGEGVNHQKVVDALSTSLNNPFFTPHKYFGTKQCGLVLQGRQLEKNRLIVYAKHLDLLKGANKPFVANLTNRGRDLYAKAINQIRVEVNHTSFDALRKRLRIPKNNLVEVLSSTQPTNHDFLMKITGGGKQLQLFTDLETERERMGERFSPNRFLIQKGVEGVVEGMGYDYQTIKRFFQTLYGSTFKYHWIKQGGNNLKWEVVRMIEGKQVKMGEIGSQTTNQITKNLLDALKIAI
jgi:hypothetical protein